MPHPQDVVICIDAKNAQDSLHLGSAYTVTKVQWHNKIKVQLSGHGPYTWYDSTRFVPNTLSKLERALYGV